MYETAIVVNATAYVGEAAWQGRCLILPSRLGRTPLVSYLAALGQTGIDSLGRTAAIVLGSQIRFDRLDAKTVYTRYLEASNPFFPLLHAALETGSLATWDWTRCEDEETILLIPPTLGEDLTHG